MSHTIVGSAKGYADAMIDQLKRLDCAAIEKYAQALFEAWRDGRRVYLFGNGGSAYTASHHVMDYLKTAAVQGRKRLQAFSVNDNFGITTALGNDISYDDTFRYPLETYAKKGDIAVAISCSGNSPNVVKAVEWAKANGVTVVALTGFKGGKIGAAADIHIHVPSDNYGVIEDLHMSVGHIAAQMLKNKVEAA